MFNSLLSRRARKARLVSYALVAFTLAALMPVPAWAAKAPPAPKSNDRNWISVHIFDTIWPFDEEGAFPETLSGIETIMQTFNNRMFWRTLASDLKITPNQVLGNRTDMGHYLMWAHFSDEFVANHPNMSSQVDSFMWMYPDGRHTDIFTAWGGSVNLAAFFTQGVQGLGVPIVNSTTGAVGGNFENFLNDVVPLGEADYSGGWYMTDQQAENLLTAFHSYGGLQRGYSFMAPIAAKPSPFEPPNAQLVNGYNCGDFVMYALRTAGVLTQAAEEALKVQFWYPEKYFNQPLPLKGAGASITNWLVKNPGQNEPPSTTLLGMIWPQLLFSNRGIEFFDKKALKEEIEETWPKLNYARIWDQTHVITWMKANAQFTGKGIYTELLPAVQSGAAITAPDRTVPETKKNSWPLSRARACLVRTGDNQNNNKLKDAHLFGAEGERFTQLWEALKMQAAPQQPQPKP